MARRARFQDPMRSDERLEGGVGKQGLDGVGGGCRAIDKHDRLQNSTPVLFQECMLSIAVVATARLSRRR
jgi:hypothetical protein